MGRWRGKEERSSGKVEGWEGGSSFLQNIHIFGLFLQFLYYCCRNGVERGGRGGSRDRGIGRCVDESRGGRRRGGGAGRDGGGGIRRRGGMGRRRGVGRGSDLDGEG